MSVKILILGKGRNGKDSVAEILKKNFDVDFSSSSMMAAKIFIYEVLKPCLGYKTFEECYDDRHNWRDLWHQLICAYNSKDKARLAKEILKHGDVYVGMRDNAEYKESLRQGLFDAVWWVDASDRVDYDEPRSSFNIDYDDSMIWIDNNGTQEELEEKVVSLYKKLLEVKIQ